MRPHVLSDLHFEFAAFEPPPLDVDAVVITHHAPLVRVRPSAPVERAPVGPFASDLRPLMTGERVTLSIYPRGRPLWGVTRPRATVIRLD